MTLHTDVDVSRRDDDAPLRDDDDTDRRPAGFGWIAPRPDDDDAYADLFSRAAHLVAEDFAVRVVSVQRDAGARAPPWILGVRTGRTAASSETPVAPVHVPREGEDWGLVFVLARRATRRLTCASNCAAHRGRAA